MAWGLLANGLISAIGGYLGMKWFTDADSKDPNSLAAKINDRADHPEKLLVDTGEALDYVKNTGDGGAWNDIQSSYERGAEKIKAGASFADVARAVTNTPEITPPPAVPPEVPASGGAPDPAPTPTSQHTRDFKKLAEGEKQPESNGWNLEAIAKTGGVAALAAALAWLTYRITGSKAFATTAFFAIGGMGAYKLTNIFSAAANPGAEGGPSTAQVIATTFGIEDWVPDFL